jgi:hypothetical protein
MTANARLDQFDRLRYMPTKHRSLRAARAVAASAGVLAFACLPFVAAADVVTGTLAPANAKAIVVNAAGETVAELKPGSYQLQLPVGKYTAQCQAPKQSAQEFLSLSEPVTVNIDCAK